MRAWLERLAGGKRATIDFGTGAVEITEVTVDAGAGPLEIVEVTVDAGRETVEAGAQKGAIGVAAVQVGDLGPGLGVVSAVTSDADADVLDIEPALFFSTATGDADTDILDIEPEPFEVELEAIEFSLADFILEAERPELPLDGKIVASEYGTIALVVEAGICAPGHFVAVRGWLSDPDERAQSIWLQVDDELRQVEFSMTHFREDLVHLHQRLGSIRPGLRAGFVIAEPWPAAVGSVPVAYVHVVVETLTGPGVLSNGILLGNSESRRVHHVIDDYRGEAFTPAALAAVAGPALRGIASDKRELFWRDRRLEELGREGAEFSYIVVVNNNVEMVGHILGFLEMDPKAKDAEVVFVLQAPHLHRVTNEFVRTWRGSDLIRAIKVLRPASEISFGSAVQAGVELCGGRALAIATDELVPPEPGWMEYCLRATDHGAELLLPSVRTFDGRAMDLSHAIDLPWEMFEHDHSGLVELFRAVDGGVSRLPYGALVAKREVAAAPGFMDEGLTSADLCFLEFLRRRGPATLKPDPDLTFIHNRLSEHTKDDAVERLWNLYAALPEREASKPAVEKQDIRQAHEVAIRRKIAVQAKIAKRKKIARRKKFGGPPKSVKWSKVARKSTRPKSRPSVQVRA